MSILKNGKQEFTVVLYDIDNSKPYVKHVLDMNTDRAIQHAYRLLRFCQNESIVAIACFRGAHEELLKQDHANFAHSWGA